jgi:hypothetical protein
MATWVEPHNEVSDGAAGNWQLLFQEVTYHYDDGTTEDGFRFIWRQPNGNLQPARGQARIPDAATHDRLVSAARAAGWF